MVIRDKKNWRRMKMKPMCNKEYIQDPLNSHFMPKIDVWLADPDGNKMVWWPLNLPGPSCFRKHKIILPCDFLYLLKINTHGLLDSATICTLTVNKHPSMGTQISKLCGGGVLYTRNIIRWSRVRIIQQTFYW